MGLHAMLHAVADGQCGIGDVVWKRVECRAVRSLPVRTVDGLSGF